ncbi:MAG: hypothetical protein JRN15_10940 [Nitrososphaerota archaeon]|nr:hypothetical protein [Nitrososphaerota archaeon]
MASYTPTVLGQQAGLPPGGVTAQQPVQPPNITPSLAAIVDTLPAAQTLFRQLSTISDVPLDTKLFTNGPGSNARINIDNVGLGIGTISQWQLTFSLANSGAAAETVSISPWFPYNLIDSSTCQINGGAVVYSASGPAGFLVASRKRRGIRRFTTAGGAGPALSPALVSIVVQNATITNTAVPGSISGITSISIAAGATATLIATFVSFEDFTLDENSLLGALPLQHNGTSATLVHTLASSMITTANSNSWPFYNAGANVALTLSNTSNVTALYRYASVPADANSYLLMVANSYQVQEDASGSIAATGSQAGKYNIPREMYLAACHFIFKDNNGNYLSYNDINQLFLQYNGGNVVAARQYPQAARARQYLAYADDVANLAGVRVWDGNDTSNNITNSDTMGWLNTYDAANPQFVFSLPSGIAVPVTFSTIREQIVAGNVRVV